MNKTALARDLLTLALNQAVKELNSRGTLSVEGDDVPSDVVFEHHYQSYMDKTP